MARKPRKKGILSRAVLSNVKISPTERAALASGSAWWDAEIFNGHPDWNKLFKELPAPQFTAEEQAFLDGPVTELCAMISDWEMSQTPDKDVPQPIWDFMKKNGFLGLEVAKEHGGHGFSALLHREVVQRIASRSYSAAISVMVPNSLGPAKLIEHYGTDEQKKTLLPRLARGEEIPCFALTEPGAGSDATSIKTKGTVVRGVDGKISIKIDNIDKRYSTLAPVATVIGLAMQLEDPENLLGKGEKPGITVALVPRETPGLDIGRRHNPLGVPFQNGPIRGAIEIGVEHVVGGLEGVGNDKGWNMLVEQLAIGRGISLPSVASAGLKMASHVVGQYSRVRRQFGMPIGKMEGVEEAMARIGGLTYIVNAASTATVQMIDAGHKPAIPGAILKYHTTEAMRKGVNDAMDVLGGKAIMEGPNNFFAQMYKGLPIAITVEGANIMTRSLIIFGQGAFRSHSYVLPMVEAAEKGDEKAVRRLFAKMTGDFAGNRMRAVWSKGSSPVNDKDTAEFYQKVNRLSSAFNVAANISLASYGATLKSEQHISKRLGDVFSNLYLASMVLRHYEVQGRPKEDLPLVRWACQHCLDNSAVAFRGLLQNFGQKPQRSTVKAMIMRVARDSLVNAVSPAIADILPPSDKAGADVAKILYSGGPAFQRLTSGIYLPDEKRKDDPLAMLADAYAQAVACEPIDKKIREAVKAEKLSKKDSETELLKNAVWRGVISEDELKQLETAAKARDAVINVDDFPQYVAPAAPAPSAP